MSHHTPKTIDPVYRNSKRETFWILIIWAVFAAWVLGVSAWLGYGEATDGPAQTVLGFPKWVFWGIAVPWLGANVVIISFAAMFMKDDPLEAAPALNQQQTSTPSNPASMEQD